MWRQSFIVGQTASSREEEQQREHKPPNTLHYSLFYPPSFFFFHVVAVQSFSLQCYFSTSGGVIPFSLPSALSIPSSLDFLLDYFVSAHQCKPAPWKHSLLFISIAPCWIAVRFHGQRASEIKWIETIDSFLAGRVRERLIGQEGKKCDESGKRMWNIRTYLTSQLPQSWQPTHPQWSAVSRTNQL